MKSKNFKVAAFIFFIAVICLGVLWLTHSTATAPGKTAQTPAPTRADANKQTILIHQLAKPLSPPVRSEPETAAPTQAKNTPPDTDPRADPDAALAEGIRLVESKDYLTFLKDYRPPERFNPPGSPTVEEQAKALQDDPSELAETQKSLARMLAVQGTMPVMSHNGDTATYTAPDGLQIVMMRIDGHWIFAQW